METNTDKVLDTLEHLWPILTGIFLIFIASIRLLWYKMTQNFVTKDELYACRADVREDDEKIGDKIDRLISDNAKQHHDIMKVISNK